MTTTYILDDVLVQQDLVGHLCEGRILQINFRLARGSDFVMMNLDDDTAFLEGANHLGSNVLLMIHRRDGGVAIPASLGFLTTWSCVSSPACSNRFSHHVT